VITVPVQLSVAVAGAYVTVAAQVPAATFTVRLAGQVIKGAMLSTTVTVKVQVAVRPAASRAVAVTVVVPRLNVEPDSGLYVIVAPQLSVAVAANVTAAVQALGAVFTVMLDGQAIVGFWLSTTVTRNVQVAVRPERSVAITVTVVAPKANVLPEAGLYVKVAPQLSVAVAA
jgi:hypothetical protein